MGAYSETFHTYLQDGWQVAPLNGGQPLAFCNGGGTDDPDTAAQWADSAADANIGLVIPPDTVVVTVLKEGHGTSSFLDKCRSAGVTLPHTRCVAVPRGGLQIWFRGTVGLKGEVEPGIYVNTSGTIVPAPPSSHPNGKTYQLLNPDSIAALPPRLQQLWSDGTPRTSHAVPAATTASDDGDEAADRGAQRLLQQVLGATLIESPVNARSRRGARR
jgi:hypothetical protein